MNRYDEIANRLPGISHSSVIYQIGAAFRAERDIEMTNLKVSLLCPYNRQKILMPVRGRFCRHLQCYDLKNFIKMNEALAKLDPKYKWKCPYCNKETKLSDLEVDEYNRTILKKVGNGEQTEIELFRDGSWEAKLPSLPTASKKQQPVVDLVDDEEDTKPAKRIKLEQQPPTTQRQPAARTKTEPARTIIKPEPCSPTYR